LVDKYARMSDSRVKATTTMIYMRDKNLKDKKDVR